MNLAIFIVVAAVIALLFILRIAVTRGLQFSAKSEILIQPIDVQAFRNLVSTSETEYLRQHLPTSDFRRVHRERLRATLAYVRETGRNAAVLASIGQTALAAGDPRTVQAARELVNNALLVRRNAGVAILRIYVGVVFPNGTPGLPAMLDSYERLSGSAMLLGRLQNPAVPVRVSTR